jgi:Domain of unknown function (DUF4082)
MTLLNTADAIYVGDIPADKVYLGDTLVWEPPSIGGWGPQERMLNNSLPTLQSGGDYTRGVRFTVGAFGRISHIRYYNVTGVQHTLSLWTVDGIRVASVVDPGAVGWREVALPTPYLADPAVLPFGLLGASAYSGSVRYDYGDLPVSLAPHLTDMGGYYSSGDTFPGGGAGPYHYHVDVVFQEGSVPEGPWTPASIPGLGLWLEADAITGSVDGGPITSWPDQGPNHYQVVPSPSAPTWQQAGVGGKPSVYFNNNRLIIQGWGNALSGKSEYTLFHVIGAQMSGYPIVLTAPTYSGWQFLTEYDTSTDFYWGHTNGSYGLYDTNIIGGRTYLHTFSLAPSSVPKFYQDGAEVGKVGGNGIAGIAVPPLGGDIYLGQYYDGSLPLIGHVAAIIWYDHYLIDSERVQVENYLMSKYGLAAGGTNVVPDAGRDSEQPGDVEPGGAGGGTGEDQQRPGQVGVREPAHLGLRARLERLLGIRQGDSSRGGLRPRQG